MRTFDWALFELYNDGHIAYDEAIRNADSANELRLNIKLKSQRGEPASTQRAVALDARGAQRRGTETARQQELQKQQEKKREDRAGTGHAAASGEKTGNAEEARSWRTGNSKRCARRTRRAKRSKRDQAAPTAEEARGIVAGDRCCGPA